MGGGALLRYRSAVPCPDADPPRRGLRFRAKNFPTPSRARRGWTDLAQGAGRALSNFSAGSQGSHGTSRLKGIGVLPFACPFWLEEGHSLRSYKGWPGLRLTSTSPPLRDLRSHHLRTLQKGIVSLLPKLHGDPPHQPHEEEQTSRGLWSEDKFTDPLPLCILPSRQAT